MAGSIRRTGRRQCEVSDPVSMNRYTYVGGDPVNRVDPRGTDWVYVGGGWCSTLDPSGGCYDPGYGDSESGGGGGNPCPSFDPNVIMALEQSSLGPTLEAEAAAMGCTSQYTAQVTQAAYSPCTNWGCMPAALARAISALQNNPLCDQLFGTAQTRANGFNPIQIISQVYSQGGGLVGPNGSPVGAVFAPWLPLTEAVTFPILGPYSGATVVINGASSSMWNVAGQVGDTLDQATLLLHELGHVYSFLTGSGGSQIQLDGFGGSQQNQNLVMQKCF